MKERLEQLHQIQKLCTIELQQIQSNTEDFSISMETFIQQSDMTLKDDNNSLTEIDSLLTSITTIMDYSRKLNIQLQLHMKKLSGYLTDPKPDLKKEIYTDIPSSINGTDKYLYPAEEIHNKEDETELFIYPKLLLNEIYEEGSILNAVITYIKDIDSLSFYIFDKSSPHREPIVDLSKSLDLRQYHNLPPANEIFGYVTDQHIFRAVRSTKILYDDETKDELFPVYLLDTGEIVALTRSENITYRLTESQKVIPALAVLCKLNYSKKNPFVDINEVQKTLKELENMDCLIKVTAVESNILYVELSDEQSFTKNTQENCSNINKPAYKKLTDDELEMLYEEPFSTSNAMKAVMGYDPQDDKRICRFYNPKTGACFKGSNCKLEHTLRQPDGWTKDILPSATIIENLHPIKVFPPESLINITPTYIERVDRFYAQINDPNETIPLVWNDDDIPSWKRLSKPPYMFELVLSRYIDGLWYRAKIISHDDDYKMFKVFYVDYGNHQVVHLNELASIDISMSKLPFKAVLCRIASVNEKHISEKDRQKCVNILSEMILNKSVDVKVLSHYEDLFITFVNKKDYPIPDILIKKKYLTKKPN